MKQKLLVSFSILFLLFSGKGNSSIQAIGKVGLVSQKPFPSKIKNGGSVLKFANPFFKYL